MVACIADQCGAPCEEPITLHKCRTSSQLAKATCSVHLGTKRAAVPFDCVPKRRLSYLHGSHDFLAAFRQAKCRSRWPSQDSFGWKAPNSSDGDKFFKEGADSSFLPVQYDDASDDEDGREKMLVFWKSDGPPVNDAYAACITTPLWAEHGQVRFCVNAEDSRLECQGPIAGKADGVFRCYQG